MSFENFLGEKNFLETTFLSGFKVQPGVQLSSSKRQYFIYEKISFQAQVVLFRCDRGIIEKSI